MGKQSAKVWYATHEKINSITKFVVFNDRGSLDLLPDQIQYRGRKFSISMQKVVAVSLASQRIPWVSYAISNIFIVLYFAIFYSSRLSPGAIILILILSNLFGLWVGKSTKWVRVEYHDQSNELQKAYFADSSWLGWGGLFGGTSELWQKLKPYVRTDV